MDRAPEVIYHEKDLYCPHAYLSQLDLYKSSLLCKTNNKVGDNLIVSFNKDKSKVIFIDKITTNDTTENCCFGSLDFNSEQFMLKQYLIDKHNNNTTAMSGKYRIIGYDNINELLIGVKNDKKPSGLKNNTHPTKLRKFPITFYFSGIAGCFIKENVNCHVYYDYYERNKKDDNMNNESKTNWQENNHKMDIEI